jgi:hypothetical protein
VVLSSLVLPRERHKFAIEMFSIFSHLRYSVNQMLIMSTNDLFFEVIRDRKILRLWVSEETTHRFRSSCNSGELTLSSLEG